MSGTLSQHGQTHRVDVLVIGTGLAGLHYCLQLLRLQPKLSIALLSKAQISECNSRYAQGGIAAVSLPTDSLEAHINDTLQAGDGLCYPPSVESIIRQGPGAIDDLKTYGIQFQSSMAQEGGHSARRIHHCGDQTGIHIMNTM